MKPYALFPRTPGLFSSLNVQKNMLQDEVRNRAFKEAIFRNVKKGDVVIDLGTGTGILAIWAAQAGAKKVYAIEETDVADVAEAVIKDNGFQNIISVLKANSSKVILPESADVLIAELAGHFLFEEGIVEAIAAARNHLLKPGARIIPQSAKVFLAPTQFADDFDEISFWDTWENPSLGVIRSKAANTAYVETVPRESLLAEGAEVFNIDFSDIESGLLETVAAFVCHRHGRFDGVAGWFDLELGANVFLSTSPSSEPTHWRQCIFPLERPRNVKRGEMLDLRFAIEPFIAGCKWYWKILSDSPLSHQEEHALSITYGEGSRLLGERF
jgi:predicted RNA methylase